MTILRLTLTNEYKVIVDDSANGTKTKNLRE